MIGTTLRHTSKLIAKRPILSSHTLSPLSDALYQIATTPRASTTQNNNTLAIQIQTRSITKPTRPTLSTTPPLRNLPPSIIAQIKSDLASVDADKNGKIDAQELRELLKKHNSTFTDDEIVELSELFYASRGAGAVPMEEFLEALDGAARGDTEKGNGLTGKKFKTHPLGIGTCASEYM